MAGGFEAVVGVGLLVVALTVEEEEVEEALEAAEEGREEVGAADWEEGLRDAKGVDMGREEEEVEDERDLEEGPATDGEGSGCDEEEDPFLGAPPARLVEDEELGNLD